MNCGGGGSCSRFVVFEYSVLPRSIQPIAISFGLALALAVTHGLGLSALPVILPAMMADLGWTYTHAGLLGAATSAGLFLGLLLTVAARGAVAPARLFQLGLVVAAIALVATGAVRNILPLAALRFVTGFATAPLLASAALLASSIYVYEPDGGRRVLRIFRLGIGAGIIAGGALLPLMLDGAATRSWPEAWLTLGLMALVSVPFAIWASRRIVVLPLRPLPAQRAWPSYAAALTAATLFTVGLTAILTFLPIRAQQQGANGFAIAALWTTLGLAGILSRAFWELLLDHLSAGQKCAAPMAMAAIGALLVLIEGQPPALIVAAALIGFGAFMIPVSLTQLIRETLPRECWPRALSVFLLCFAASQTLGALAAGLWADHAGALQTPLSAAAGCLVAASIVALLQSRPAAQTSAAASQRLPQLDEPPVPT
jgi:MFS family permease